MVRDAFRLTQNMLEGNKLGLYLGFAKDRDSPSAPFCIASDAVGFLRPSCKPVGRLDFTGLVVVRTVDGHSYCRTDLLAWNYYQDLRKQN